MEGAPRRASREISEDQGRIANGRQRLSAQSQRTEIKKHLERELVFKLP